MKLPAGGVEYVTYTVTSDFTLGDDLDVLLSTDPGTPAADAVWSAATWDGPEAVAGAVHTRSFTVLLAGTGVDPVPGGAVQVSAGLNYVWVKVTDTPEIVIRPAGKITGL